MRWLWLGTIFVFCTGCGTKEDPVFERTGCDKTLAEAGHDTDAITFTSLHEERLSTDTSLPIIPDSGGNDIRILVICTQCHSQFKSGADRNNATVGLNWDVYETVVANEERMRTALGQGRMPLDPSNPNLPRDPLSEVQLCAIETWFDRGAPE